MVKSRLPVVEEDEGLCHALISLPCIPVVRYDRPLVESVLYMLRIDAFHTKLPGPSLDPEPCVRLVRKILECSYIKVSCYKQWLFEIELVRSSINGSRLWQVT